MLAPTDRRLLLDVLSPPEGYALDQALGTTFTLDLLALLRVPLAATALPWSGRDGEPVNNPFALLTALRRNAARISLYCHAGATKVPGHHVGLLAFLEDAVHPVSPPRAGGYFHPKLWLLRFAPDHPDDPIAYRLLVLSRNLTFDHSWDTALMLDGELLDRQRGIGLNAPLSDFVAALPRLAGAAGTQLSAAAVARAEQLSDEVRRVAWDMPDGFDTLTFHPIGHDGRSRMPIAGLRRLLVLSPFVGPECLRRLGEEVRQDISLVSRHDELLKLDAAALDRVEEVEIFDDPGNLLDVGEQAVAEGLSGLHAKVYVGERGKTAAVYVGSANATRGAFERNVEFMVELEGSRKQHGIDSVRESLRAANLLTPFVPGESVTVDDDESLERAFEQAAHALATALQARVEPDGVDRWRTTLELTRPVDLADFTVRARPLSEPTLRKLDPAARPCCTFPPAGLTGLTAFFHLQIISGTEAHDVTARLRLIDAPTGRTEAVTAELLSDRERLLRFILLLLSEEGAGDRMLDELERLFSEAPVGGSGAGAAHSLGLPLLEPMLRALHRDPERLEEIDRLLHDLRAAGGDAAGLLPPELDELWTVIDGLRTERS